MGRARSRVRACRERGEALAFDSRDSGGDSSQRSIVAAYPAEPLQPMNVPLPPPRILLVEDEPTSAAFLAAAARATPAQVEVAGNMATALAMANRQRYGLWLFDAHLPDGSGGELLSRLQTSFPDVPAIAHTASNDPAQRVELERAGFLEVLHKPLPAASIQTAVRRVLGLPDPAPADPQATGPVPLWDDQAAATALNGNDAHVATLRGLFVAELPQACERIGWAANTGDLETVGAELHRLRASCGFVGAAKLGALVQALQREPSSTELLGRFAEAARATLTQLPGTQTPGSSS